jgi:methylphosphotriester-DNA--protein-cysteine methyltransferase
MPAVLADGRFHAMDSVLGAGARATRERAGNAPTDSARVATIVEGLHILVRDAAEPDAAVAHSVRLIELHHGRGSIDRYLPAGLQTRQWQRRFFAATGLTPKAFARLTRLQRLVGLYESGLWRRWADLALEMGFYDQSHLANEFRSFSGQSPDAFFREGRGMAEFYRDGFFQDSRAASR